MSLEMASGFSEQSEFSDSQSLVTGSKLQLEALAYGIVIA